MSLAFLGKKSWNPTNRKNVDDVKKREEAARQEARKMHELKKEYAEERERETIDALQVKAGLKKKTKGGAKLAWMYESDAVAGSAERSAEDSEPAKGAVRACRGAAEMSLGKS